MFLTLARLLVISATVEEIVAAFVFYLVLLYVSSVEMRIAMSMDRVVLLLVSTMQGMRVACRVGMVVLEATVFQFVCV